MSFPLADTYQLDSSPDMRDLLHELRRRVLLQQGQGRNGQLSALQSITDMMPMVSSSNSHQQSQAANFLGLSKNMLQMPLDDYAGASGQASSLLTNRTALRSSIDSLYGGLTSSDLSLRHSLASTHPSLVGMDAPRSNPNMLADLMAVKTMGRDADTLQSMEAAVDMLELQRAANMQQQLQARNNRMAGQRAPAAPLSMDRLAALRHAGLGGASTAPSLRDTKNLTDIMNALPPAQAAALLGSMLQQQPNQSAGLGASVPDFSTSEGNNLGSVLILEEAKRLAAAQQQHRQTSSPGDASDERKLALAKKSSKKLLSKREPTKEPVARGRKGKKSYKRKKPQDMPRRPLSAYNLFFSSERERILKEIDAKENGGANPQVEEASSSSADDGVVAPPENKDDDACHALLRPMVLDKPRVHKKMHGKVDFRTLAKMVGARWGQLSAEKRKHYQELAKKDTQRHKVAMELYYKKKHEQRMALLMNGENGEYSKDSEDY